MVEEEKPKRLTGIEFMIIIYTIGMFTGVFIVLSMQVSGLI